MPIVVTCPHCQAPLAAPDAAAGRTLRCPACRGTTVAPGGRAPAGWNGRLWIAVVGTAALLGLGAAAVGVWWAASRPGPEVAATTKADTPPAPPPEKKAEPPPAPPSKRSVEPAPPPGKKAPSPPPAVTVKVSPAPKAVDPVTIEPRARFTVGAKELSPVLVTADGSRAFVGLRAGYDDQRIEEWTLNPTPAKVRVGPGVLQAVSADGTRVLRRRLADKLKEKLEVVNPATGGVISTLAGFGFHFEFAGPGRIVGVAQGPQPANLSGPHGLRVDTYDAATGAKTGGFDIPGHAGYAKVTGLVAGGRELVVGWGVPRRAETWDVATGKLLRGCNQENPLKLSGWSRLAASPDGKLGSADGAVNRPLEIFDLATGAKVSAIPEWESGLTFIPGRPDTVLVYRNAVWRAHDLSKAAAITALLRGAWVATPTVSADGRVMVARTGYDSPVIVVYDLTRLP